MNINYYKLFCIFLIILLVGCTKNDSTIENQLEKNFITVNEDAKKDLKIEEKTNLKQKEYNKINEYNENKLEKKSEEKILVVLKPSTKSTTSNDVTDALQMALFEQKINNNEITMIDSIDNLKHIENVNYIIGYFSNDIKSKFNDLNAKKIKLINLSDNLMHCDYCYNVGLSQLRQLITVLEYWKSTIDSGGVAYIFTKGDNDALIKDYLDKEIKYTIIHNSGSTKQISENVNNIIENITDDYASIVLLEDSWIADKIINKINDTKIDNKSNIKIIMPFSSKRLKQDIWMFKLNKTNFVNRFASYYDYTPNDSALAAYNSIMMLNNINIEDAKILLYDKGKVIELFPQTNKF